MNMSAIWIGSDSSIFKEVKDMSLTKNEERINELFEELVPAEGKADAVAGEIIRAVCRIHYRNWNDGDHIGVGYGKETCNAAARYLQTVGNREMREIINDMWGMISDRLYDAGIATLLTLTLDYLDSHPELKTTANAEDMFDYYIKDEDEDTWDDEEEEDY